MTTAKHPQGAAYNGTGALKLSGDEPRRNFFRRMPKQEPEEKRTKAAPAAQKPPAAPAEERKGENLLMSFLGGWSIRGAFLAIAVIAAVIIGTLISNAQLVMVNDQMVELRSTLSDLQDQETQLKAQYAIYLLALCGKHDDGHIGGVTNGTTHALARKLGKHEVQHDQVKLVLLKLLNSGLTVTDADDPIALALEVCSDSIADGLLVLDQKDLPCI